MEKSHLILKNPISYGNGVRLNSNGFPSKKENEDDEGKDYDFQVQKIHECQERFYSDIKRRHSKRDKQLQISHYDYIRINFFKPFRDSVSSWGLKEMSVADMGLSVLFWIENKNKFDEFMKALNNMVENVELIQSEDKYKKYTLINSFELFDSDSMGSYLGNSSKLVIKLVPKNSLPTYKQIVNALEEYLGDNRLKKLSDSDSYSEIYEINILPEENVRYIKDNFDVIQTIQSIPLYKVSPDRFKRTRFTGIFEVDMSNINDLPVVGLIDSGIDMSLNAFNGLIVKQVSIIEEPVVVDEYHGTSVASLIIFGKQNLTERLIPQAKVYSIQVYRRNNNKFSLLDLKNAIITARESGVRIFNISMSSELSKDINSDISVYAQMLDELAYKYNILFIIATGNSDDINEDIPYIYYDYLDPNNTQDKNIGEPGDCMNGITVGAMFEKAPTLYTKKSYIDFSMKVNDAYLRQGSVNINLHKPDVLIDGGKDSTNKNGIPVIGLDRVNPLGYSCGTSLATPYITNLCARILKQHPTISISTLKTLIINSTEPSLLSVDFNVDRVVTKRNDVIKNNSYCKDYNLLNAKSLCRMIEGHGIVDETKVLYSNEKSVTIVLEEVITNQQVLFMKLKLPGFLRNENVKGNVVKIYSTLCFTTPINRFTDPINYNRYFISYRFINTNESDDEIIKEIEYHKEDKTNNRDKCIHIKGDLDRWSDSFRYVSSKAFSNVNNIAPFLIRKSDLLTTDNKIGIAFHCVHKDKIDTPINFSFCMRIELVNEKLLESGISLYDELCAENDVIALNENIAEATATLDV